MNTILDVKNIEVSFGPKKVIKGVDMEVPDKTIVALIGPSGCGKSTLLRSMNRMHDLTPSAKVEGEILLSGQNIFAPEVDVVEIRRKIGMVFQRPNPFPKSIFDNVAYGLKINGERKRDKLKDIVEESLKSSSLWDEVHEDLDKSALELSGGQQQRLCIARSIAIEPELLLMDEPCSALDPISTDKIEKLMLELKDRYAIVIVTHNLQQAQRVADFTAFMYLGELIEYAPTEEIFNNPKEKLTQNYIAGHFG